MSDLVLALRTFARVAEGLSFSRLAEITGASHTTIARRIDQLEAHFGVRLLDRTTRRLTLTPEGLRLVEHARAVVEAMEHTEAEFAAEREITGTVRVGVTTALGLHYADRLADLHARHPQLRIEFAMSDWQTPLAAAGVDIALRVDSPAEAALEPLGAIGRVLVAAPAYIAARGAPRSPAALRDHDCIAYGYGPAPTVWDIAGERLRVSGGFRANSSEAVFRALVGGLGIGLLPVIRARAALAAGALVPVLPDVPIAPLHIALEHRYAGMRMPARVRALRDFLVEAFPQP